jgi:hypothetical protein
VVEEAEPELETPCDRAFIGLLMPQDPPGVVSGLPSLRSSSRFREYLKDSRIESLRKLGSGKEI